MKHYVLLRFKDHGSDKESSNLSRANISKEILGKLIGEVDGFKDVKVYVNCIDREDNYDLMIEMDLANEKALNEYLDHPYHKEFIAYMINKIESKVSFDYKF